MPPDPIFPSRPSLGKNEVVGRRYRIERSLDRRGPWEEYLADDPIEGRLVIVEARVTGLSDPQQAASRVFDVFYSDEGAATYVVREVDDAEAEQRLPLFLGIDEHDPMLVQATQASFSAEPPEALAPGIKFARRYLIAGLLGRGGMGAVYRAHDTLLDREVALKLVHASALPDTRADEARKRVVAEAKFVSRLRHPHIVELLEAGEENGTVYLVLELCAEGNLRTAMATASAEDKLRWLIQIAEALDHAHQAGILHRDVKPENILITEDGNAKLADFGIARAIAPHDDPRTTGIVGTPRYMAPEQLLGESLDGRADQYAWGLVAYEILTGAPLRPGGRPDAARFGTDVNASYVRAITRALEPNRQHRYPTVGHLISEVSTHVPGPWSLRGAPLALVIVVLTSLGALAAASKLSSSRRPTVAAAAVSQGQGAAFREQALRGAWDEARRLVRALPAEKRQAPESLRLAIWSDAPSETARNAYVAALNHAPALSEVEHRLLDAYAPFTASPARTERNIELLRETVAAYPLDEEAALNLAFRLALRADVGGVRELSTRWTANGGWIAVSALALERHGDHEEAIRRYDECLLREPRATYCARERAVAAQFDGDCEAMQSYARSYIAAAPSSPEGYRLLEASALFSAGAAPAAREAHKQRLLRDPDDAVAQNELFEALLAAFVGDFYEVLDRANRLEAALGPEGNQAAHSRVMRLRLGALSELERGDELEAVVAGYAARSAGWSLNEGLDFTIFGYNALYASGRIGREDYRRVRQAWVERSVRLGVADKDAIWEAGFATSAQTEEEAREALAMRADGKAPTGTSRRADYAFGNLLRLIGRNDEALAYLRRTAHLCSVQYPFEQTRAYLDYAKAASATERGRDACNALAEVRRRWRVGRTAREASSLWDTLRCASLASTSSAQR